MSLLQKLAVIFCVGFLATYLAVALLAHPGYGLTEFADISQASVLALAVAAVARHIFTTCGRQRTFWALLTLGGFLWFLSQFEWVWYEVIRKMDVPDPSPGDVALFIHVVPFMAALVLRAHSRRGEGGLRLDRIDFSLLLLWWIYLYAFIIMPWQFAVAREYQRSYYNFLYLIENIVVVAAAFALAVRAQAAWRKLYAGLFLSASIYTFSSFLINQKIVGDNYYSGSLFDVPLVASMCVLLCVGALATTPLAEQSGPEEVENRWASILATIALISMPVMAIVTALISHAPREVTAFRMRATVVAMLGMTLLVIFKQSILNTELRRLLRHSHDSLDRLQRMQAHLVNSEKLAALGQLVAGAAHEINNPLTAILGYADILATDPMVPEQPRSLADKIGNQARRTKRLVANMLTFAQQQPATKGPVQLNSVMSNALQLREPDLAGKKIRVTTSFDLELPDVWGDSNHLLQVFLHILNNAVDALQEVGGGIVNIFTSEQNGMAVVEIADTGPGIKDPSRIFDPFYTTKPVGKGTGLGLSVCYGVVHDHGGEIICSNNPNGGAQFLVKLPSLKGTPEIEEKMIARAE